jgi:N-dimethylarginine dimethylaminohydrolase
MKKILVCDPEYFEVSYEINPWMKNKIGFVNSDLAKAQWTSLIDKLSLVSNASIMQGVSGLPDMVFTANAGILVENTFLVSKFATKEREPEQKYFAEWAKDYTVVYPNADFEGEGDCLQDDHGRYWLGHGFRSSISALADISTITKNELLAVKLVDPRWYHLDTAFCPIGNNTVMWYPSAFDTESQQLIRSKFNKTIDLTLNDALCFAANCVVVENSLFLPHCSKELQKELESLDYRVETFDLSEFLKSGGAAKCLTMYLN